MKKLILGAMAIGLLFVLGMAILGTATAPRAPSYIDPAIQQAQTKAQLADIERGQFAANLWLMLGVGIVVTFCSLVIYAAMVKLRLHSLITSTRLQIESNTLLPNNYGNYPVRLTPTGYIAIGSGNAPTNYPNLTHLTLHQRESRAAVQELSKSGPAIAELPPPAIPDFGSLLDSGEVGKNKILLGWTDEGGLWGSWLDLYSLAVSGYQGSGKTNSAVFYAAQAVLMGCKLAIADKHAGHSESLTNALEGLGKAFICRPASNTDEIAKLVKNVHSEVESRIQAGKTGTPLLLIIEELPALLASELGQDIAALLIRINDEGRKYAVYCLGVAQRWKSTSIGNTNVRNSFASVLTHRMKREEARLLLPTAEEARHVPTFKKGEGWLYSTSGELSKVQIPLVTASHIDRVARIIEGEKAPLESPLKVVGKSFESPLESAESAPLSSALLTPEESAIVTEFFERDKSLRDIVQTIWGISSGSKYNDKLDYVQGVIRKARFN